MLVSLASVSLQAGQAALNDIAGDGSWASKRAGRLRGSWLEAPFFLQMPQHVACEDCQAHTPSLQEEHAAEGRQKPLHK